MDVLRVRRLEFDDLPTRVRWMNSCEIYSQMPLRIPVSLSETRKWFADNLLKESRYDFAFCHGRSVESPVVCMAGLVDIDYRNRRAELYIMVDPARTGQGLGSRCLKWLCNFGFGQLNLNKLYLYTLEDNWRARRFYERYGFVHEGTLRKHAYHLGDLVDRYVHGLLRSEWTNQEWATTKVGFEA